MKKEFEVGDVVQLKSGGPRMTITGDVKPGSDYLYVSWFDLDNNGVAAPGMPNEGSIHAASVILVSIYV